MEIDFSDREKAARDADFFNALLGSIKLAGTGRGAQEINLDMDNLAKALVSFTETYGVHAAIYAKADANRFKENFTKNNNGTAPTTEEANQHFKETLERLMGIQDAWRMYVADGAALTKNIKARVVSLYEGYEVKITDSEINKAMSIKTEYLPLDNLNPLYRGHSFLDINSDALTTFFNASTDKSTQWNSYQLDKLINPSRAGVTTIGLGGLIFEFFADTDEAKNDLSLRIGNTIAHEAGHNLGLPHTYDYKTNPDDHDIMSYSVVRTEFAQMYSYSILKLAVDGSWGDTNVVNARNSLLLALKSGSLTGVADGSIDGGVVTLTPGPHMLVSFNEANMLSLGKFDVGTTIVGSRGGATINITNVGDKDLTVSDLKLSGAAAFNLVHPFVTTSLKPGENLDVEVNFAPVLGGEAKTTVAITSNDQNGIRSFGLVGNGLIATPSLKVDNTRNNLGGVKLGAEIENLSAIALSNVGAQTLSITDIKIVSGGEYFSLIGLPADLASNPISLATNAEFLIGAIFKPGQAGLQVAQVEITTNDPANPKLRLSVVGTGYSSKAATWGNDFLAIEFPGIGDNSTIRLQTDDNGHFDAFLPAQAQYHIAVFDPGTGLIAHGYGTTSVSGQRTNLTGSLVFEPSVAPDSDSDGLPHIVIHKSFGMANSHAKQRLAILHIFRRFYLFFS